MTPQIIDPNAYDRRRFLGGSDAAAVLGLSPWLTPVDLFFRKLATEPEQLDEKRLKFFRNRKAQEPIIAQRLQDEYGIEVTKLSMDENPNRYVDPDVPYFAAEIDFEFAMNDSVRSMFPSRIDFAAIPDGRILNGEIKTVHPFAASKWGDHGTEDLPIEYAAQAMWGAGVVRREACLVAAMFGVDDILCFPVMADQATIVGMREKSVAFWTQHVLTSVPPAPINVEDVAKLYSGFKGRPAGLTTEGYNALVNLAKIRGSIAVMEREKGDMEWIIARDVAAAWGAEVIKIEKDGKIKVDLPFDDNALLMFSGIKVGTWNRQAKNGIDSTRLKKEKPDIAAAYNKVSKFRVMRIAK